MTKQWHRESKVILETQRFRLQSVNRLWLARRTRSWTDDPNIMLALNRKPGDLSLYKWWKKLPRANNRTKFLIGIFVKETGNFIGYETVKLDDGDIASLAVVIGDKTWWGKGVVVEVRQQLLQFLFDDVGCSKVWGTPNVRNFPAIFNYHRLGFTQEGIMRAHVLGLNGEARGDRAIFGMLRSEWVSRQQGRN